MRHSATGKLLDYAARISNGACNGTAGERSVACLATMVDKPGARASTLAWDTQQCRGVFADSENSAAFFGKGSTAVEFDSATGAFWRRPPHDDDAAAAATDAIKADAQACVEPCEVPKQPRVITWEDTLRRRDLRLRQGDFPRLALCGVHGKLSGAKALLRGLNEIFSRGSMNACEWLGLPLAIGTRARPVRGLELSATILRKAARTTAGGKRMVAWSAADDGSAPSLFVPLIEKSGSSTLVSALATQWVGVPAPLYRSTAACRRHRTHIGMLEGLEDLMSPACSGIGRSARAKQSERDPRANPPRREQLHGCGYAASFARDASSPSVALAMVREPIGRFISGVFPHRELGKCEDYDCIALRLLRSRAREMAGGKWQIKLLPPDATVHAYTQSYYLSATSACGEPIAWDRLLKLEELSLSAFEGLSEALLPPSARHRLISKRENAKNRSQSHMAAILMLGDLDTICDVCTVYAQDFVCLGYPMPLACRACRGPRAVLGSVSKAER